MRVQLNCMAVEQLEKIMQRMGYKTHQHALQVMLSTITSNLRRADEKKNLQKYLH
ncbi:hypothetical protein D3C76_1178390 [compost metagenome]